MAIPLRKTDRLTLRSFRAADVKPLHRIMGQPDMLRYFPSSSPPDMERVERIIKGQLDHWELYDYGWWAVEENEEGQFIGWAGLQFLPDTDEMEIAYMLDRVYWQRGLATEAANSGLQYGFHQLQAQQIVGIVHPENVASIRVLEKLGMTFIERKPYFGMDCFRYVLTNNMFPIL